MSNRKNKFKRWFVEPPKAQFKILLRLAQRGPMTKWQLKKKWKKYDSMAYSTIHQAIKALEAVGWVKALDKKKKSEKGLLIKIYGLTLEGILWFSSRLALHRIIDQLAGNYKDALPLIFGKWSHFKKFGVNDVAEVLMVISAQRVMFEYVFTYGASIQMGLEEMFYFHFYDPRFFRTEVATEQEWKEKWRKAIHADVDLKELVEKICKGLEDDLTKQIQNIRSFRY